MMNRNLKFMVMAVLMACFAVTAGAQIPDGYYDSLKGKNGAALKNAVYNLIKKANVLNYGKGENGTWGGFWQTDRTSDGRFIDRYSPESDWVKSTNKGAVGSGMNIEHSFPKSWWGGENNQAYKDLYNLMPCEATINSAKSNYGMGKVTSTDKGNGYTKVGYGDNGFYVWEPADEWKGDFARGYMYMATCYQNFSWEGAGLNSLQTGAYPTLKEWAYKLYMEWARADKPTQLEITRNNAVSKIQGNRNPFVDFPNLMEYIWGDSVNYAFDPTVSECSANYTGDDTPVTPDPDKPFSGTIANYDFTLGPQGFTVEYAGGSNTAPGDVWQTVNTYGWKGTGYINKTTYAVDASIVSPVIDLQSYKNVEFSFNHAVNYIRTDKVADRLSVIVRCEGNSYPLTDKVTMPAGTSWDFVGSGNVSLEQFAGKKIQLEFRYTSTSSVASTWEIKNLTVTGEQNTDGISAATADNGFDATAPYELYTIGGQRLQSASPTNGVVIIRQNGKSWKTVR